LAILFFGESRDFEAARFLVFSRVSPAGKVIPEDIFYGFLGEGFFLGEEGFLGWVRFLK
jgi:hypothetical protein